MSSVSVSREALHKVKTALGDFQTGVDTATAHMKAHLEEEAANIQASIKNSGKQSHR